MSGNLSADVPLNFVSPLFVSNRSVPSFSSSTSMSFSCTSARYEVIKRDEIVNFPSDSISRCSVTVLSIAISRLFPIRMSFLNRASIRILSSIGVNAEGVVAWLALSTALRNVGTSIRNRIEKNGKISVKESRDNLWKSVRKSTFTCKMSP